MNKNDNIYKLIIAETVCVAIMLLSIITVKYFFKSTYKSLYNWYCLNVLVDTDIEEVLGNEI